MIVGQRTTRPRRIIREALATTTNFVSAREVYELVHLAGDEVGLATVYRTLHAMTLSGDADAVLLPDGEALYRKCSRVHHHHVVCRECGAAIEVISPPVADWSIQVAEEYGFDEVAHTVEVFGRCPQCRSTSPSTHHNK